MKKNKEIKVTIERLGSNGEGVGVHEGTTVFIPFSLPGEIVSAEIVKQKNNVADGKLKKILSSVNGRVSPVCPVFGRCGGCQLQHMNRALQLVFKTQSVKSNFKRIAGLDIEVESAEDIGSQYGYRNKLQIPIGSAGGTVITGFFAEGSHRIVPTITCPLHNDWADKLIKIVTDFANENGITAYDEKTKQGVLRHVVARYLNSRLLVTVVINADALQNYEDLCKRLAAEFKYWGLFFNINKKDTNVILGEKEVHLGGITAIESECSGVKFSLQQRSFFQINETVAEAIYLKTAEIAKTAGADYIIDAFSGIGVLSGILAKQTGLPVYALEIVPEAFADAERLKEENGLKNLNNVCGDVNVILPDILRINAGKRAVLVVDPPRRGLEQQTIDAILKSEPDNIIYISCDSATLSRDVKKLSAKYRVGFCKAYDMFPQTRHVETLAHLVKI